MAVDGNRNSSQLSDIYGTRRWTYQYESKYINIDAIPDAIRIPAV